MGMKNEHSKPDDRDVDQNPSNYSGLTNITRSFSDTEKDVLSDDDIERYENQETEGRNHASSDDDAK